MQKHLPVEVFNVVGQVLTCGPVDIYYSTAREMWTVVDCYVWEMHRKVPSFHRHLAVLTSDRNPYHTNWLEANTLGKLLDQPFWVVDAECLDRLNDPNLQVYWRSDQ